MLQVQDVSKVYRAAGRRLSFNRETAVCVILTGVLLAVLGVWKKRRCEQHKCAGGHCP